MFPASFGGDMAEYTLYLHQESPKAFLVSMDPYGDRRNKYSANWVPASQVEVVSRRVVGWNSVIVLEIPDWLADKLGLDASLDADDNDNTVIE